MKSLISQTTLVLGAVAVVFGVAFWALKNGNRFDSASSLDLKEQLRDPHKYVAIVSRPRLAICFLAPVISRSDLTRLGIEPSEIGQDMSGRQIWSVKFFSPNAAGTQRFKFYVKIVFSGDRVTEVDFPAALGRFVDANSVFEYMAILGASKIDFARKRSFLDPNSGLTVEPISLPNLPECRDIFGPPNRMTSVDKLENLDYRLDTERDLGFRPLLGIRLSFKPVLGTFAYGIIALAGYNICFTDTDIYIQH